ncbi:MAG: hypothetical protein QOG54_1629 [Actinomycetota bacterium]|nr:hypothetical protein [Actinomycetota bacterium]
MVFRRIAEQRQRVILGRADDHLDEDEEVLHWIRASKVNGRGDGFLFLTPKRVIVNLSGREDDRSFTWSELQAWGIAADVRGGPVIALETEDGHSLVQMRAQTDAMAREVATFIEKFAGLAPMSRDLVNADPEIGEFKPHTTVDVKPHKLTIGDQARRVIVTILGAAMMIFAILIIPLPGPWSLLITIGGFAILATEYDWAKDALDWLKEKYAQAKEKLRSRRKKS